MCGRGILCDSISYPKLPLTLPHSGPVCSEHLSVCRAGQHFSGLPEGSAQPQEQSYNIWTISQPQHFYARVSRTRSIARRHNIGFFVTIGSIYLSDIANIHILNIQMNGSRYGIVVLNPQVLIIQGCEFLNVQQYAIEIHRSVLTQPDIVIQHCLFVGGNAGISIWDISNLKLSIQSCEFLNESTGGTGIEIYGETLIQDSMDRILIQHCRFTVDAQCGISIGNVSTLLIQHCEFYTNQHELNGTGVYIENNRNTVIRNSTFIHVKQGIWAVKNTQTLVIQGCEFQNVEYAGISIFYYTRMAVVHDSNTLLIQHCLFVNGEYGILTVNAQNHPFWIVSFGILSNLVLRCLQCQNTYNTCNPHSIVMYKLKTAQSLAETME